MKHRMPTIPAEGTVPIPTADVEVNPGTGRSMATRDHQVIRAWAARHSAEPATGEATASGPSTIDVKDGGAGVRFNFPGVARFRPISWDEWFENFDRHRLVFVYDEEVADRAFELSTHHDGEHGRDREDWFEAERQLRTQASRPVGRYRLLQQDLDQER